MSNSTPDKRLDAFVSEIANELDDIGYCPGDYERFRAAVAAAVRGALPTLIGDPQAWLITYNDVLGPRRVAFLHNAIGDYRDLDPNAISISLYSFPTPSTKG